MAIVNEELKKNQVIYIYSCWCCFKYNLKGLGKDSKRLQSE